MIDPKNVITATGGVVSDPELINDKIAKFRLAIVNINNFLNNFTIKFNFG